MKGIIFLGGHYLKNFFSELAKLIAVGTMLSVTLETAFADDSADLRHKLHAVSAMSANFSAEVKNKDGTIAKSSGKMALKRPDRLLLHTLLPDETVLFTRGKDLCYYDPFVNQLSLFTASSANSSPFLLLTDDSIQLWSRYVVKKVAGGYKVSPKKARDIVAMILLFKDDVISSVSLEMKEGSVNTYTFTDVEFEVDDALFDVDIPDDAEIDDERGAN